MGKEKKQPPSKKPDINEIFKAIKKPEQKKQKEIPNTNEDAKQDKKATTPKQPTKKQIEKESKLKEQSQNKFTEEGFKIYKAEDLKIGKGGDTNLCPFDCDCCF